MDLKKEGQEKWNDFRSLDLGCGIGRHVSFLNDFGLNPYGIDLSDEAISMGKDWFISEGKNPWQIGFLSGV